MVYLFIKFINTFKFIYLPSHLTYFSVILSIGYSFLLVKINLYCFFIGFPEKWQIYLLWVTNFMFSEINCVLKKNPSNKHLSVVKPVGVCMVGTESPSKWCCYSLSLSLCTCIHTKGLVAIAILLFFWLTSTDTPISFPLNVFVHSS